MEHHQTHHHPTVEPEHPYHDPELKKYMQIVARSNKSQYVIFRALLTGVFTAVGTTIGFALLIFLAAAIVTNLKHIPILDSVLRDTKIDVLIEDQLSKISTSAAGTGDNLVTEGYLDSTYQLMFDYPSSFTSIQQVNVDATGKKIQMTGNGALHTLEVYINKPAVITGDSTQFELTPDLLQLPLKINIYEDGVKVNDTEYTNAAFQLKFHHGSDDYVIIGFADNSRPKLAREVYMGVVKSLGFKQ